MEKISFYKTYGEYFSDKESARTYETLCAYKDIVKDIDFFTASHKKIHIDELIEIGCENVEYFQVRTKTAWDFLATEKVFDYIDFYSNKNTPEWDDNFAEEIWYWDGNNESFTCHYWTNVIHERHYKSKIKSFPKIGKNSPDKNNPAEFLKSLYKTACVIPGNNSTSIVYGHKNIDWTFDEED